VEEEQEEEPVPAADVSCRLGMGFGGSGWMDGCVDEARRAGARPHTVHTHMRTMAPPPPSPPPPPLLPPSLGCGCVDEEDGGESDDGCCSGGCPCPPPSIPSTPSIALVG